MYSAPQCAFSNTRPREAEMRLVCGRMIGISALQATNSTISRLTADYLPSSLSKSYLPYPPYETRYGLDRAAHERDDIRQQRLPGIYNLPLSSDLA